MPWAMRSLNDVVAANSASRCTGLWSPDTSAKAAMVASVTVCDRSAVWPMDRSSSFKPDKPRPFEKALLLLA